MKFTYTRTHTPHFLIQTLLSYGVSIKGSNIFEYGSTDLATAENPSMEELKRFLDYYKTENQEKCLEKLETDGRLRMKHVWLGLGAQTVDGADGDGYECEALDFNDRISVHFDKKYDIVLNTGTAEHVFNIANAFKDTHDLCAGGGIIVHALPVNGYMNHGYYKISPKLLFDIAKYNCYEILGVYKQLVYSVDNQEFVSSELPIANYSPEETIWNENDIFVFVFFRKLLNRGFKTPYESSYANIAHHKVIQQYECMDVDCFLAKNKINKDSKVAIFGTKKAAEIAYSFCVKYDIKVVMFVDDFEKGKLHGVDIVDWGLFCADQLETVTHLFYGEEQKGIDGKNIPANLRLVAVPSGCELP